MLEYSDRAKIGYAELYRKFNKRTVFIEDDAGRYLYEKLICRLMGDENFVQRVFPLNGKDAVVSQWQSRKKDSSDIYIIDGDLDLLLSSQIQCDGLTQLPFYSIENGLLQENAVVRLCQNYVNKEFDDIRQSLGVSSLVEKIERDLFGIFILFSMNHSLPSRVKTIKNGLARYCSGFDVDRKKILEVRSALKENIRSQMTGSESRSFFKVARLAPRNRNRRPADYIAGKEFVGFLVHKTAEKKGRFKGDRAVFFNLLTDYIDFSQDVFWDEFRSALSA